MSDVGSPFTSQQLAEIINGVQRQLAEMDRREAKLERESDEGRRATMGMR
jgi:hypothetical protein